MLLIFLSVSFEWTICRELVFNSLINYLASPVFQFGIFDLKLDGVSYSMATLARVSLLINIEYIFVLVIFGTALQNAAGPLPL